jgi:PiT family inorganic phosphate transporter
LSFETVFQRIQKLTYANTDRMMIYLLLTLVLALAWANGANDIAKGVATLCGGGVTSARRAILWGSFFTLLGGLTALVWGGALMGLFSKGFLNGNPGQSWSFSMGAIGGAAAWVLVATRAKLPVSTTHALIGGVIGAALASWGADALNFSAISHKALLPLFLTPFAAIVVCALILLATRLIDRHLPKWSPGCCEPESYDADPFVCADQDNHQTRLVRQVWLGLHWLSSGLVSFSRGLNDTPKIAALALPALLILPLADVDAALVTQAALVMVALAMTAGGVWGGMRLLPVLAEGVSRLDVRTGLAANLSTSMLVFAASPLGMPVSTTHVTTGSLMGVRFAEARRPDGNDALKSILFGWLVTLPVAAAIAYGIAHLTMALGIYGI